MSNALDASVTLDDIFAVVQAKRVPLAAELAGYLALEIAEGADPLGGDVDALRVFVGEEGSVALVKHRRENVSGDAEASVRNILSRLLEASGSQTPALSATAKRKPTGGLPALSMELEAALIPVNRAAGRRALARLAREVRRVTLGVGRNAPNPVAAERPGSRGSYPSSPAQTGLRSGELTGDPPPVRAPSVADPTPPPPSTSEVALDVVKPAPSSQEAPRIDISQLPAVEISRGEGAASRRSSTSDEVDSLLDSFEVSEQRGDRELARDLKAMIGLDPTPPPPQSRTPRASEPDARAPRASETEADIESLLSLSETAPPAAVKASPLPPPPAPPSTRSDPYAEAARDADDSETHLPAGEIPVSPPSAPRGRPVPAPYRPAQAYRDVPSVIAPTPSPPPPAPSIPRPRVSSPLLEERQQVTQASRVRKEAIDAGSGRGSDRILVLLALLALGGGATALWMLKPGFLSGRTAEKVAAEKAASEADRARAVAENQAVTCKATLTVLDVPTHAEVLLRVGQAPADVERMPVGTRLEFVAMADGFAPKRAVVPSGATWDRGADGKPRFEVGVQLDPVKTRGSAADLWPAAEPGSEVGGKGSPGTVHIVTTPRGAEVWLLAGVGPEAKIEQLRCQDTVDVLVAGPTTFRKRLRVTPSDFTLGADAPNRAATISVKTAR